LLFLDLEELFLDELLVDELPLFEEPLVDPEDFVVDEPLDFEDELLLLVLRFLVEVLPEYGLCR
jgi:hypothetical protein